MNHLSTIKDKLNLAGFGNAKVNGFMVGNKYYKVRLADKKIITIEKSGRIIHIFDDRSK